MAVRKFSPTQKAAILMLSLGEELAGEIFRGMNEHEVRSVGSALRNLGKVEQDEVNEVVTEFLAILDAPTKGLNKDTAAFAEKAIQIAFKGEKGQKLSAQLGRGQ